MEVPVIHMRVMGSQMKRSHVEGCLVEGPHKGDGQPDEPDEEKSPTEAVPERLGFS